MSSCSASSNERPPSFSRFQPAKSTRSRKVATSSAGSTRSYAPRGSQDTTTPPRSKMTASLGITSPPDQTTTADYGHTNTELPAIAAAIIRKPSAC